MQQHHVDADGAFLEPGTRLRVVKDIAEQVVTHRRLPDA